MAGVLRYARRRARASGPLTVESRAPRRQRRLHANLLHLARKHQLGAPHFEEAGSGVEAPAMLVQDWVRLWRRGIKRSGRGGEHARSSSWRSGGISERNSVKRTDYRARVRGAAALPCHPRAGMLTPNTHRKALAHARALGPVCLESCSPLVPLARDRSGCAAADGRSATVADCSRSL